MAKMMTEMQHEVASLVADNCEWKDGCTDNELVRFWVPQDRTQYCTSLDKHVSVYGAGYISCLRAMERKGWLKAVAGIQYAYAITEEGLLQIEKYREQTGFYVK